MDDALGDHTECREYEGTQKADNLLTVSQSSKGHIVVRHRNVASSGIRAAPKWDNR